jgi:hypothetical protein
MKFRKYKLPALVSLAMVFLAILPELNLCIVRGRDWNGMYVSATGDEPIYSAYLNALITERARKNDPFIGRDSTPNAPLPESTFSIQFIPPYVISFLARMFGASASTAMIGLIVASSFLAAWSVFWLLNAVVKDSRLAAVGTLLVLCFGGLAGASGIIGLLLDSALAIPMLPFLRRYQPAAAFPLFFAFQLLAWRALTSPDTRRARTATSLASLTLAVLVFSYLYLWTAAAAWLACLGTLWFCFRRNDRRRVLAVLITVLIIGSIALVPYAYLISHRASSLDEMQAFVSSHRFDLFWLPEILGVVILVLLVFWGWRGRIQWTDPRALYAASLAALPLVLFNQQVVTGRSMQPHHFAHFIVNYSVVVGVVVCIPLSRKILSTRMLVWIGVLCLCWGFVEMALPARLASVPLAVFRDRMVPSFLRLKQLSYEDGTIADLKTHGRSVSLVFSPNIEVSRILPTWTSQGTLLDMRGLDFGSLSNEERKKFFLMHLYYSGVDAKLFADALRDASADSEMNFYARSAMFGYDRVIAGLSYQFRPVRPDEIDREVQNYQTYITSFSRDESLKRQLTYALIPAESNFDFTNLDRWYERDAGERVGDYVLYRLKLRP